APGAQDHHADRGGALRHRRGLHHGRLVPVGTHRGARAAGHCGGLCLGGRHAVQLRDGPRAHTRAPEPDLPGAASSPALQAWVCVVHAVGSVLVEAPQPLTSHPCMFVHAGALCGCDRPSQYQLWTPCCCLPAVVKSVKTVKLRLAAQALPTVEEHASLP
ncbi:Hypothetical predicted protein, partial [Olea europaea subsp. europaea]